MTTQNNINKDMVALLSSVTDGIHQLQKAVKLIHTEINDINKDMVSLLSSIHDRIQELKNEVVALRLDMDSQHIRNDNFNDRLINLEENKIKVIDEELKRIDTLEQAFNREF